MQSELACNNVSKCCFVKWEKEKRMAGLLVLSGACPPITAGTLVFSSILFNVYLTTKENFE